LGSFAFLAEMRSKRADISVRSAIRGVGDALTEVEMPSGWVRCPATASTVFRPYQSHLPSVKVHYDGFRVDIDRGRGHKIKSTVHEFSSVDEVVAFLTETFSTMH